MLGIRRFSRTKARNADWLRRCIAEAKLAEMRDFPGEHRCCPDLNSAIGSDCEHKPLLASTTR
jgi:hypothetical protein